MKRKLWLNSLLLILVISISACKKSAVKELELTQAEPEAQGLSSVANQKMLFQAPVVQYDVDPENDVKEGGKILLSGVNYSGKLIGETDVDYYRLKNPTCLQRIGFELTGDKNIALALAFEDGSWMPVKGQSHITIIGPSKKVWVRVSYNKNAEFDVKNSGYQIKSSYYGK